MHKGSTRIVDPGPVVFECDDFGDYDITSTTSQRHVTSSVTLLIDAPQALSYRLPTRHEPLNSLVSKIFSIKVADKGT